MVTMSSRPKADRIRSPLMATFCCWLLVKISAITKISITSKYSTASTAPCLVLGLPDSIVTGFTQLEQPAYGAPSLQIRVFLPDFLQMIEKSAHQNGNQEPVSFPTSSAYSPPGLRGSG